MKLDQAYFDAVIDRAGTACEKWDGRQDVFGRGDVIPSGWRTWTLPAPRPSSRR